MCDARGDLPRVRADPSFRPLVLVASRVQGVQGVQPYSMFSPSRPGCLLHLTEYGLCVYATGRTRMTCGTSCLVA